MSSIFPKNIKGIIFDLDGTLYRMKWFMKPLITLILFPNISLIPRYMAVRKYFSGKDMESEEKLLYAMAEHLANKFKSKNVDSILSWIKYDFYSAFEKIIPLMRGHRPELIKTLKNLKENGYKTAVLSDFSHVKQRLISLNILPNLFDTLASSESEGALKPCTRPLFLIADSLHIKPSDIVVIGDRPDTDGIAAKNCGMHFIQISEKAEKKRTSYSWSEIKTGFDNLPNLNKS